MWNPDRRRGQLGVSTPLLVALFAVIAAAAVVIVVVLARDNHKSPLAAVVTPTPTATAIETPTATATPTAAPSTPDPTPVASQDKTSCVGKTFGQHLSPLNPPADVHVYSAAPAMTIDTGKLYRAIIITGKGNIFICLEPSLAPHTVNNFVTLARNNFYNGLIFHRVGPNATTPPVIQGGDPNCVTGTEQNCGAGGPGYQFNDEPVKGQYTTGTIAMANSGPNTNGSQFFIDTGDNSKSFAPSYNLFGYVESGLNVAQSIAQGDAMTQILVEEQR